MSEKLLELRGVSMAFGGLTCVDGLDLHVDEGEIVSVIGPNGAGKTTLFNLITGSVQADRRRHRVRRLEHQGPRAAQDHGARDRPDVPDAAALPQHERARERDVGGVRTHEGRDPPLDVAHPGNEARGAGDSRAGREAARVLRRAADGLPLGPARLQPLVREPPPPRDRAGDGDEPAAVAARRAGGRDESQGDPRDHGI